ncbi:hypothetical protein SARC_02863 [Sphaeroforma arctica JP610]|uniref:Uncharacterized protein n=1 Tax=Sphaeroforma arctica JP610 TaxID=667725 RepID=A0A0L0G7S1_9EUKA|nr:hypothetical protein SARC_02863 [Sphaeroforma arctica JP610]KNC84941.1 hypothetical protein SARC_02863 [Sphaeroforma arctica JP610]|eukprot:XP_014158843.1 hypothetical protein SARC_02863 [Sphaeroforma arctica JP610]
MVEKHGLSEFLIWLRNTYVQCNVFILTYPGSDAQGAGGVPYQQQQQPKADGGNLIRSPFDTGLPMRHKHPDGFKY